MSSIEWTRDRMGRMSLMPALVFILAAVLLDRPTMFALPFTVGWSAVFAVVIWTWVPWAQRGPRNLWAIMAAAAALAVGWLGYPWRWLALAAITWIPFFAQSGRFGADPHAETVCAAIASLTGLYALAMDALGLQYIWAEPASRALSSFASLVSSQPISIGPTYLGLHFVSAYILGCLAIFALGGQLNARAARNLAAALGGGIAGYMLLLATFARLTALAGLWFLALTFCLGLMLAIMIAAYARVAGRERVATTRPKLAGVLAGVAVAILIASVAIGIIQSGQARRSVMFLSEQSASFQPTSPLDFSDKFRPAFGWLPVYLEGVGYEISWGALSAADLGRAQTVVAINVISELSDEAREAVSTFLRNGGSLLILADHTLYPNGQHPLGFIMDSAGIALNFDSARSLFDSGWGQPNLQFYQHPVTMGITDEAHVQIGTGASLRIRPPARTIVAAKIGFVDNPDMNRPDQGYLGDLKYNPGERLGDIPLVAAGRFGAGKVLVFGDTSSFQNPSLAMNTRFIDQVFSWLAHSQRSSVAWLPAALIAIGAFTGAVGGGFGLKRKGLLPSAMSALAGGLVVCLLILELPGWIHPSPKTPFGGGSAVIDRSHFPSFSGGDVWGAEGLAGLHHNILRNQLLPIQMEAFDPNALSRAETLFIIGPQMPYTPSEISEIERFVMDGGRLIVSAGWEEKRGVGGLLDRFGMSIEPIPFGRFAVDTGSGVVEMPKAWPIAVQDPAASLCLTKWDKPVVVTRMLGRGRITVIGDSMFLLNPNIETVSGYSIGNIQFLRAHAFSSSAH